MCGAGYDWQAPLRAAQALFATSRTSTPPVAPTPAEYSDAQQKDLFRRTYGENWLRYWNLVHSTPAAWEGFVKAVSSAPPGSAAQESGAAVEAKQREMFMKVFGEKDFQAAWNNIMDNSTAKAQ